MTKNDRREIRPNAQTASLVCAVSSTKASASSEHQTASRSRPPGDARRDFRNGGCKHAQPELRTPECELLPFQERLFNFIVIHIWLCRNSMSRPLDSPRMMLVLHLGRSRTCRRWDEGPSNAKLVFCHESLGLHHVL